MRHICDNRKLTVSKLPLGGTTLILSLIFMGLFSCLSLVVLRTLIYLDESGDLGWNFDYPYQKGGSSRMLTLAAVCIPEGKGIHLQRVVRALYKKRKRPLANELKSVDLNLTDKELFSKLTIKLVQEHLDINIRAITVSKEHIIERYRSDPNRFYNYLIKLLLLTYQITAT